MAARFVCIRNDSKRARVQTPVSPDSFGCWRFQEFFFRQAGRHAYFSIACRQNRQSFRSIRSQPLDRITPQPASPRRARVAHARECPKQDKDGRIRITQSLISEQQGKGVNTARGGRSREHLVQVAVSAVRRFRLALADNTHCEKNDTEYDKEYEKETEHAPPGLALIGMRLRQLLRGAVRIPSDRNDVGLDIV